MKERPGTCESSPFYVASQGMKNNPKSIQGLFKLIYTPAVTKINSATIKTSYENARNLILNTIPQGKEKATTCIMEMALDFWCDKTSWDDSKSKMKQYLTWVVGNQESLQRIADGELDNGLQEMIVEEINININQQLGIDITPSYAEVESLWKQGLSGNELKALFANTRQCAKTAAIDLPPL